MKITKFGHSCLLVEEGEARILIDPGAYSTIPDLKNIDAILITHEHSDHYTVDILQNILKHNPEAIIYTNSGVGEFLQKAGIPFKTLLHGQVAKVKGVSVEGVGEKHAYIYSTLPICDNVGYLIAGRLLQPGDTLEPPQKAVEILAIPAAAPWAKLAETIDYGKAVHAKIAFPIHDGFLGEKNPYNKHLERELGTVGTKWITLKTGEEIEV